MEVTAFSMLSCHHLLRAVQIFGRHSGLYQGRPHFLVDKSHSQSVSIYRQFSLNVAGWVSKVFETILQPFPALCQSATLDPLDPLKAVLVSHGSQKAILLVSTAALNLAAGYLFYHLTALIHPQHLSVHFHVETGQCSNGCMIDSNVSVWWEHWEAVLSAALSKITNSHLYCWHSWPWTIIITAHSDASACTIRAEPV